VYDTLADVYDWLVPEALLEPEGSAAAFDMVLDELSAGARVLDCACGTGTLAVGLALRGFEVSASDASEGMVARTRALADARGARPTPSAWSTGPSPTRSCRRTFSSPASSRWRARSASRPSATS
jgi:SAM-dependent methyltransferase